MKNILPKIIVILSAIVLWFLIVSGQNYIGVVDLPLSVYEPRENMTLGEVIPKTVKVRIEGTGRALYFQRWTKKSSLILDVGAIVDNQRISLKNYFEQRPNQVRLQGDMKFLEVVYPDSIDIAIDQKISKKVTVNLNTDISVRSGFIKVSSPEHYDVIVTGPQTYLETLDHLESELLKKENMDMSFTEQVPVVNPNEELLDLQPNMIDVAVEIEMIGERTIANIPIHVKNQSDDLDIQFIPNTVSLRITGGNNKIQDLNERDFYVYFDYLSQWFPNKNYYPVKITAPDDVLDIIKITPEQVEVVVIRKNEVNE